ncbi:DJ-1 family glyoxalase III [Jeongeupia chitinilytica]|uniref:4-methyl-5(B-hydroxyethyl)-thiazole monophosphate biosynthesis protein n=1 Tax=Jeongeupia chitinilytica TaxID=1041641 RepID=A0ABQ3GXP5_9NEIS|nr:DJ-1 family glyoxalase III [Jeongeupia chitinilytica]GHD57404.1 4-methyl-5(B-hydroxyethyl)-thiazole monophosphate biosynthesis protein [Jeongeupia chitinilytica]
MATAHVYLAPGFEEVEFVSIVDVLRRGGVFVSTIALDDTLSVEGAHGIVIQADLPFAAVDGEIADAIVLPGGGPGTQALAASADLADRLRAYRDAGKRVAAVCAAPTVLAKAGLLEGKSATCFPGCEPVLAGHGATVSTYQVVTDGLITTSRAAGTSGQFALEVLRLLAGDAKALEVGRAMLYL